MGYARKDVEKTKKITKKFVRYQEGAELYSIGLKFLSDSMKCPVFPVHFNHIFFCIFQIRSIIADSSKKKICKFCSNGTPILKLAVHPF